MSVTVSSTQWHSKQGKTSSSQAGSHLQDISSIAQPLQPPNDHDKPMRGALQPVRAMLTLLYQATWCQFGVLHGCLYKLSGHGSGHSSMSKVTSHNVLSWWQVQGGLKLDGSICTTFHLYYCLSLSLMMWISQVIGSSLRVRGISICTCFMVLFFLLLRYTAHNKFLAMFDPTCTIKLS